MSLVRGRGGSLGFSPLLGSGLGCLHVKIGCVISRVGRLSGSNVMDPRPDPMSAKFSWEVDLDMTT